MRANNRPATRSSGAAADISLPLSRPRARQRALSVDEGLRRGHAGMPVPLPGGGGFLRVVYSCNGRGLAATSWLPAGVLVARFAVERTVASGQWPALLRAGRYALHISSGRLAVVAAGPSASHCATLINSPAGGGRSERRDYVPPNCRLAVGRSRCGDITGRVYTSRSVAALEELRVSYGCRAHMAKVLAEASAAAAARAAERRERRFGWTHCALCGRCVRLATVAFHQNAHRAAAARRGAQDWRSATER